METFASSDIVALLTFFNPETHFLYYFNLRVAVIFIALFQFFFNCAQLGEALSPFFPSTALSFVDLDWNGLTSSPAIGICLIEFAANILLFIAVGTKCRQKLRLFVVWECGQLYFYARNQLANPEYSYEYAQNVSYVITASQFLFCVYSYYVQLGRPRSIFF